MRAGAGAQGREKVVMELTVDKVEAKEMEEAEEEFDALEAGSDADEESEA